MAKTEVRQLRQGGATQPLSPPFDGARQVPLASLWKLFVYVYATDNKVAMPDYRCGGRDPEEVYCCDAGQSIGHDAALAQSCGPFFSPRRLMITATPWRKYWTGRLGSAPAGDFAWLADPAQMAPARTVRLDSLLRALDSIPAASRVDAEAALLRVVLDGRGAGTARWFGSQLRVKTYSWHEQKKGQQKSVSAARPAGWPTARRSGLAARAAAAMSLHSGRPGWPPVCRKWARPTMAAAWSSITSSAIRSAPCAASVAWPQLAR